VTLDDLLSALKAAGIDVSSESFEVAVKPSDETNGGLRAHVFEEPEFAVAWLAAQPEGDRYVGVNAVKRGARPPHGRARDSDVSLVRVLVVDVDPGDPPKPGVKSDDDGGDADNIAPFKRTEARKVAGEIAELLRQRGDEVTVIDSGRGVQLWLRHDPVSPDTPGLAARSRILRELADHYDRPGLCHVDTKVGNLARLARLPGSVNSKTGEAARLL
jgi:hypothetical protein